MKNTFTLIMVGSILTLPVKAAYSANRHEFQKLTKQSGKAYQKLPGLPTCEAPMVLWTKTIDRTLIMEGKDIKITQAQSKAIEMSITLHGSALVCQSEGHLVINPTTL